MSKPEVFMHHGYLVTATKHMCKMYPGGTLYVRLTDHEAAMSELRDDYNDEAEDAMAIARRFRDTEAERNELLGLLRDMLRTGPTVSCHSFHHAPKDLHGDCEECPVMSRYENAREAAQKYLERQKC